MCVFLYLVPFQMVRTARLVGPDQPLEMVYFVEGPSGERLPAVTTATMLNSLDVQRAAIVLGYRVQGILAQRESAWAYTHTHIQTTLVCLGMGMA